ncbi:MAG: C25 family cysteine peptidase [Ignavibacteria bacterium]
MLNKITLFLLGIFVIISPKTFAQGPSWITPGKIYLKTYVAEDGMKRISKTDFTNAGISVSTIDPRTVKVFYKGSQIPIYFFGEADGIFNDNDYFDFFGARNRGGLTKTYNEANTVVYTTDEYYNQYSDTNLYWIDWNGVSGLRYSSSLFTSVIPYPSEFFQDLRHFEKDKIYTQGENVGVSDVKFLTNEKYRGEGWYWSLLNNNQSVSDTFSSPYLNLTGLNSSVRIFAYPQNKSTTILNEHSIQISVNGTVVNTIFTNDNNRIDTTINFPSNLLLSSGTNNIICKYLSAVDFNGAMYFDLFEIKYPKSFRIKDNVLNFDLSASADTTSKLFRIKGFNSLNPINVYDVKNNILISNVTISSDTLKFTAKSNAKIELINKAITAKPFKIRQKQVPDLTSNINGADYLLIYNKLFQSQVEQLRSYRQAHNNYRSVKTEIEDIYDIFNFGMEDPIAVKSFVKYIYDNWQLPKLQYICLFGRGSLDPKKNLNSSVYFNNLIPVYGNPNSDGYFANLNVGSFFYYDQISIGRIPAYYESEAQTMVDKIITYEGESPARWWKNFTYITGGYNYSEQQNFQIRSNYEINSFVTPPPISGEGTKVYRTDTAGITTYNIKDSIVNAINKGTLFVNFRGHAGSHDWEVMMNDPNTLSNGNKLPILVSLTCFTGENAKTDLRGFGERFMYLSGKGSIGFVGTTGWSFASTGNDFGTHIMQSIRQDSTRSMGDLLKVAGKKMSADSLNFQIRHTVNSYNLLGDPALKLNLPRQPEFVINSNDYTISNSTPAINESALLTIYPKNYGLKADSCKIRFQLKKNNQNYSFKDTVYKPFNFLDTIKHIFKLDSTGIYSMVVTLDQGNWYPQEIKTNNTLTITIPSKNNTFVPVSPVNNSVLFKDSVEFSGLNPNIRNNGLMIRTFMQLDTSKNFNSPLLRTFINNDIKGPVTKFRTSLALAVNNTVYHWRTNSIVNGDTSGWSGIQTFVYNNGIIGSPKEMRFINSAIPVVISKFDRDQFSETDFYNTGFFNNEIKLHEHTGNLFVRSYGSNGEEASYFSVDNKNIYIDAGRNTGLNIIKVKKLNGTILEFKNFKVNNPGSSDPIIAFLNTFDSTHYMMLLNASYDTNGPSTLTAIARSKFRQFGSVFADSIGLLGYFHTWSFIGSLGANSSQVSEMYDPCCTATPGCVACDHWTQSISSMNVTFRKTEGSVSNIIGPAQTWSDVSWSQNLVTNSDLSFDIIGIDKSNNQTTLFSNVRSFNFTDLTTINAFQYPRLNLLAKFSIDSVNGNQSSSLNSIKINYSPAAELVLEKNSLQINNSTRDVNNLNFSFSYSNAGFSFIYGTIVNVYRNSISDTNLILTDTVNSILKMDSTKNYSNNFKIPSFRDSTKIFIYITPKGQMNELFTYNNSVDFNISSSKSRTLSLLEVFGDGKMLSSGDQLSKKPEIKVNLSGKKDKAFLNDTTSLLIKLNDNYVPYFMNGTLNPLLKTSDKENIAAGFDRTLYFYPEMVNGKNKLTVVYKNDPESYDTVSYDVIVSDELAIKDLYNYPNPMINETDFVFELSGYSISNMLKIKIYTVSGKLIRELEYPANPGNNHIQWDGKDNDGDFVANGTYLYKLVIDNESKTETKIQKLVVLK